MSTIVTSRVCFGPQVTCRARSVSACGWYCRLYRDLETTSVASMHHDVDSCMRTGQNPDHACQSIS